MTSASIVVLLMILAPGLVAFPLMLRDGLAVSLAVALTVLLVGLWALVVVFVLVITSGSAIAGPFWVILLTAVVVVEILRLPSQRHFPPNDNYPGLKK